MRTGEVGTQGSSPHDVSTIFDTEGIAIRAGHHCAMPLVVGVLGEAAVSRIILSSISQARRRSTYILKT